MRLVMAQPGQKDLHRRILMLTESQRQQEAFQRMTGVIALLPHRLKMTFARRK